MLFQRRMKEHRVFITLINPSHPIFLGHFFNDLQNSLERINLLPPTSSTLTHNLVFTTSSSSTLEFILAPKPSNTSTCQPQSFVFRSFSFSLNKFFPIVSKSSSWHHQICQQFSFLAHSKSKMSVYWLDHNCCHWDSILRTTQQNLHQYKNTLLKTKIPPQK